MSNLYGKNWLLHAIDSRIFNTYSILPYENVARVLIGRRKVIVSCVCFEAR